MRDAFIQELTAQAERNERLMLITGDLGFSVLDNFARQFPRQFLNVGVAEQNMTAIACGLALEGRKVFTYSIANFTTLRCLEQLRNDVCYHEADVTAVAVGGGFSYGQLGMSHFATEDLAILRALPNMRVFAPTGLWETVEITKALATSKGPAYLRLDKSKAPTDPRPGEKFALGSARIVRDGNDVSIIATGAVVSEAITAAENLAVDGVQARVVAVHSVKPLDVVSILNCARETAGVITVEEHSIIGGLAAAVAEACLVESVAPRFFVRLGIRDVFPTVVGDQDYLRNAYGMDSAAIERAVRDKLAKSKRGQA